MQIAFRRVRYKTAPTYFMGEGLDLDRTSY